MTTTPLLVSFLAALVAAGLGAMTARRAAYERVVSALNFVSEGPVASARHQLGAIVYDYPQHIAAGELILTEPENKLERSRRIEDLFTVFWAATRLNAIRRSLGIRLFAHGPHKLLKASVGTWVKYWMQPEPAADKDKLLPRIKVVAHCLGATIDEDDMAGLQQLQAVWTTARVTAPD